MKIKYFEIRVMIRFRIDLTCSFFRIFLIITITFNDLKFVFKILKTNSIWLMIIEKHCILCFQFLKFIKKMKKIVLIIIIFIESFEFKSKEVENWNCCFLIFHLRFRCNFNARFVLQKDVFVATIVSISKSFQSKVDVSLSQSSFETNECFKFDVFDSFSTIEIENSIFERSKMIYWCSIITICSTLFILNNTTLRRQLDTFHRRFDSKNFKRLILINSQNMLSWWLHLIYLNINLSYVIFNMTSCLFIHDFSKIIEWFSKSIINKETMNSKCNFIVNLKYITWMIKETWRSSNSIRDFNFNNDTNFMFNMLHTNCVIFRSMKAYLMTSIFIKIFNLCWLSSKNNVQLIIKNSLLKESNMLSSWIEEILKHLSIASLTWMINFSNRKRSSQKLYSL